MRKRVKSWLLAFCCLLVLALSACAVSGSTSQGDADNALDRFASAYLSYKELESIPLDRENLSAADYRAMVAPRLSNLEAAFSDLASFENQVEGDGREFIRVMKKWVGMQRESFDLLGPCMSDEEVDVKCTAGVMNDNSRRWQQIVDDANRLFADLNDTYNQ